VADDNGVVATPHTDRSARDCPASRREDGEHCAHSWSHDECCWCGTMWGEGGAQTQHVTKAHMDGMLGTPLGCDWPRWRKTHLTQAMRMAGPFTVETREGTLTCPDGYLAVDAHGWPYPIAANEFEAIYEPASLASDEERSS
jgi:hypothetical protein